MIFAFWKNFQFNPQRSAIFFKGKTPQLWYCYKKKQVYWVELSFALCSLPIFTTRSFKTVSFSAPSSPNLIFFWGLGLLASSFTTVNNQPAKLFSLLFFAGIFCKETWRILEIMDLLKSILWWILIFAVIISGLVQADNGM